MAKSNRKTRKELEEVIGEMIQELMYLRKTISAIDNYVGAYLSFKGDTIMFSEYLQEKYVKAKEGTSEQIGASNNKDVKDAKKSRYKKVSTPPL